MTERARILILTFTTFTQEPRALKQVQYLREHYDVTTAGFGRAPVEGVRHIELPELPPLRWGLLGRLLNLVFLTLHWYRPLAGLAALDRAAVPLLTDRDWDIVLAHDLKTLDAAFALHPRSGVLLDLHEYAPRQEEEAVTWRLLIAPYYRWMCRTKVPKAAAVVTVGHGIAAEFEREFGVASTVVVNATPFHALRPGRVGDPVRLVHSGTAAPQRRLDVLIDGVRESSADVTLDLMLVGDEAVLAQLRASAEGEPRIRFREPVPYRELIRSLNGYDVGVHLLPPINFNHRWALPNKFFDYVQARLGVIIGPSPEMARFVGEHGLGVVLPDFEPASLARALEQLTADRVAVYKAASDASAAELSSESQAATWNELIPRVLAGREVR